jgi:hypothetical protein
MKGVTLVYYVNSFFRHASHGQKYNFLPMVFWGMFGPFLHIAKTLSHVLKLSVTSISFTITTVALFHGILSFPCKASAVPKVKCNQARVYLQRQQWIPAPGLQRTLPGQSGVHGWSTVQLRFWLRRGPGPASEAAPAGSSEVRAKGLTPEEPTRLGYFPRKNGII